MHVREVRGQACVGDDACNAVQRVVAVDGRAGIGAGLHIQITQAIALVLRDESVRVGDFNQLIEGIVAVTR